MASRTKFISGLYSRSLKAVSPTWGWSQGPTLLSLTPFTVQHGFHVHDTSWFSMTAGSPAGISSFQPAGRKMQESAHLRRQPLGALTFRQISYMEEELDCALTVVWYRVRASLIQHLLIFCWSINMFIQHLSIFLEIYLQKSAPRIWGTQIWQGVILRNSSQSRRGTDMVARKRNQVLEQIRNPLSGVCRRVSPHWENGRAF